MWEGLDLWLGHRESHVLHPGVGTHTVQWGSEDSDLVLSHPDLQKWGSGIPVVAAGVWSLCVWTF